MFITGFYGGATSQEIYLRAFTISTGLPATTLSYNTAGLSIQYKRAGTNSAVAITPVTVAVDGAWTSGGFVHVADGWYRLCVPNNALLTGAVGVLFSGGGISDVAFMSVWVDILGSDPRSSDPAQTDLRKINNISISGNGVSPLFGVELSGSVQTYHWPSVSSYLSLSEIDIPLDYSFEATHLDRAHGEAHFAGIKAVNPTFYYAKYELVETFFVDDRDDKLADLATYCTAHSYTFEDCFLHYYNDTNNNIHPLD